MARVVEAPGFVDAERVDAALRRALCMVLPSQREGYGLIVVEAAARGLHRLVLGQLGQAVEPQGGIVVIVAIGVLEGDAGADSGHDRITGVMARRWTRDEHRTAPP